MSNDTLAEVDVNTDNLDEFNDLFLGRAAEKAEEVGNEDESTDSELEKTEDDSLANEEQDETEETTEDEDVTDSDEEETDEEEETEEDTPKTSKKKTAQERINEITAARREAERKADMLEGRLAEMERRLTSNEKTEEKPTPAQEAKDAFPNPEDKTEDGDDKYPLGEFDPAFIRDLTRATIAQEREADKVEREREQQTAKLTEAQKQLNEEWNTRISAAVEAKEDFVESVNNLESAFSNIDPQYGEYLANTIKQSEYGTDILYYLSQNVDVAREIADSGPTSATLALGRLEARFMADDSEGNKPTKPATKVTKASAPPPKHTRGTGGKQTAAPDTDDLEAFEKLYFK